MVNQPRPLSAGYEQRYADLVTGPDTLFEGNIGKTSGRVHMIGDSYPRQQVELPNIYNTPEAAILRDNGGAHPGQRQIVNKFVSDHKLLDRGLVESLPADASPLQQQFVTNLENALTIMVETAVAIANSTELPSYADRYRSVTGHDPILVETAGHRDELRAALAECGFETSQSRNLQQTAEAWEQDNGYVKPEDFAAKTRKIGAELLRLTRKNIFQQIDFSDLGYGDHLEGVLFDGLDLETLTGVSFTGSSAYDGGLTENGKPAMRGMFEYNTDHRITEVGLLHLVAHEMIPGHYMDSAIADLGWQTRQSSEFERVVHTMCTAETVLREGWAQNALAMTYGGKESDVISQLGPDHRVHFALERLQDAGKNNSSLLYQQQGLDLDGVRRHLSEECSLNEPFVNKLAGAWTQHPIVGPMYGPAYHTGYETVKNGIARHNPNEVATLALHRKGFLDNLTFQTALNM